VPHLIWKYWSREKVLSLPGIEQMQDYEGNILEHILARKICMRDIWRFSSDFDCTMVLKEPPHPNEGYEKCAWLHSHTLACYPFFWNWKVQPFWPACLSLQNTHNSFKSTQGREIYSQKQRFYSTPTAKFNILKRIKSKKFGISSLL
jgi:hypothetical protein